MEDSKAKDQKVSNALNQVEVIPVKGFLARAKELDDSAAKNKQAKKEAAEIAKAASQPIIKDSKAGPVVKHDFSQIADELTHSSDLLDISVSAAEKKKISHKKSAKKSHMKKHTKKVESSSDSSTSDSD
tara:strand:- start:127 stop:513 length:387 start_codon:yes stop_codon:yes gene_type:complete